MNTNNSNIETWKEVLLALQSMFDDKLDLETIQKFFVENEQDIERTVDAILVYLTTKVVNEQKTVEIEVKEGEPQSDTSDDEDSFEREFEHIEEESSDNEEEVQDSQLSISPELDKSSTSIVDEIPPLIEQFPTVDLGSSEVSADVSLAQSIPDQLLVESIIESTPSIGESSQTASLQVQIEELTLKLSEATLAKQRVEEEKKHAMKWCLAEMQKLRDETKEKDETIMKQQSQIDSLQKQLQDKNANKLDKFITESKQMLAEGVQSLSEQINAGVNRVQSEFKDNEKDWIFVEKLKEFASEFKKELLELFKDPLPKNPFAVTKKATIVSKKSEKEVEDEDREIWKIEKASLESYVKELENRVRMYQEEERMRALNEENSQSVATSTSDSQSNEENQVNNDNNNNNRPYLPQPPVFAWPLQYNPWSGMPQNQWNGNQR